jgi:hypothetical protein
MNLKEYLTEEIDTDVKKIKKGDQISFYVGKGKGASNHLFTGKVKKVTKDTIYVTTKMMQDYESMSVKKSEMVLDK